MAMSHALVLTPSGAKYMIQLCKHWGHKLDVVYNDTTGRIVFDADRKCTLHALPNGVEIEVETATEEQLARTQETVANHLRRFAFREELGEVSWRRLE